jgi:uncharacterized protein YcbX
MAATTTPHLAALCRYPVKGLSPEQLESVAIEAGQTVPFDRAYAMENGPGRFNPDQPKHLPKINFLMLMRDERLATLMARFDTDSETLSLFRDGRQVARGQLTTPIGRTLIEQFLAAFMQAELRGPPKVVSAPGHSFSDVSAKCVHIVNLASVRDLERHVGRPVDPLRFRANLYLDGLEPWAEFGWLDKVLAVGTAQLGVFARTQRCAATNVDPGTGARDMAIPATLQRGWGHMDFGIYAKVITGGQMTTGDTVTVGG